MGNWEKWRNNNIDNRDVEKGLLSRKDAADYLDISIRTLDTYVARGVVKSYNLPGGRLRKFRKSDLENFISTL
tara:strand:+ start:100 stop:318 length:219 start_codon:yes stop_codon:yes gene_type:complete